MSLDSLSREACEIEAMKVMAIFERYASDSKVPLTEYTGFDLEGLVERVRELRRLHPQGSEIPVHDFYCLTDGEEYPMVIGAVKGGFTIYPDGTALVRVCFKRAGAKRESTIFLEVPYPTPKKIREGREKALNQKADAAPASE